MDPLTHAVSGFSFALGLEPEVPRWAVLTAAGLSANAPDIDFVARAFGARAYFSYHHGITHSFVVAALLGAGVAAIVGGFIGRSAIVKLLPLCVAGSVLHVVMDWITPWGGPLLWPATGRRLDVGVVGFFDVVLLVTILAGVLVAWRFPHMRRVAVIVSWGVVLLYLGARALEMRAAARFVRSQVASGGAPAPELDTYAPPLGVHYWSWCVVAADGEKLSTYDVDTWNKTAELRRTATAASAEDLAKASGSKALPILTRQYDHIVVEKETRAGGGDEGDAGVEQWTWSSAAVVPGADYALSVVTAFAEDGELVDDRLVVDIRGFYDTLIDLLWKSEGKR